MAELPSGTVTFLFSDIEGSTRLLQRLGDRWGDVVAEHNRIMRTAFADAGGREVDRQGDAFFAVFPRARNALAAAATIQRALTGHNWPDDASVLVRMGVHTGEPALGDEGYLGLDVVRAARICALAQGGQVLVSEATRALVRDDLDGLSLEDAGEHRLKDLDQSERLFRLAGPGLRDDVADPVPAVRGAEAVMDVAGREVELANEALARMRELELGPLATLGTRIDQQVREALAAGTRPDRARIAEAIAESRTKRQSPPVPRRRPRLARTAVVVAAAAAVVVLLAWLASVAL